MEKWRVDLLLVERGLAESPERAHALIMAGRVEVDGEPVSKPGRLVRLDADVQLREIRPYVSRGGEKLEAALRAFGIDVTGFVVADVGASTGGFTDCLLQAGADKVYAIDVGYGQLAWSLQQDPRVVVMDRTNIRHLRRLPESVDLATVDVSFISLAVVLPNVLGLLNSSGQALALVKPQFEALRDAVQKGGVVRDPEVHRDVLHKVLRSAGGLGATALGILPSPLLGPAGNVEFFVHVTLDPARPGADAEAAVAGALARVPGRRDDPVAQPS
ncbi:MAG: TlyA family RNA methyltransferase [Anaerolineae bacterium]